LVHLRLAYAEFTLDRPDEGTAVFFMEVINLWRRKVTIDRLLIQPLHAQPDGPRARARQVRGKPLALWH